MNSPIPEPSTTPDILHENKLLELDLLNSLIKRLESFLPHISGHGLIEVELNPQYILTRKLILQRTNSQSSICVSYCFYQLTKLIEHINANHLKLREMDDKLLSSNLLILKILVDVINNYWTSKKKSINKKFNSQNFINNSEFSNNFEISHNFQYYFYFEPPQPIKYEFFTFILSNMIKLFSGEIIKKIINLIQKRPIDENKYYSVSAMDLEETELSSIQTNDDDYLIQEIDSNIEIILIFLAAANPNQYYNFIFDNFFKYFNHKSNENHEDPSGSGFAEPNLPRTALATYTPLIKFIFYNENNGIRIAKSINKILDTLKNTIWKQIILVFYASSIKDHSFSRPLDYAYLVENNDNVIQVCKRIFDATTTIFEEIPYSGVNSLIQSWISVIIPGDYKEFELKKRPNKLRINFNKRIRFINNLLKDSANKSNLTCFNSLVNIFHLAGRFPAILHDHPIYTFSINHLDDIYNNLKSINLSKFSSSTMLSFEITQSYDNLLINFLITAIMLKPEKYLKILINDFYELTDNFRDVRIIIKVIRCLSESEITIDSFNSIINTIAPSLKLMIINGSRILNQFYENNQSSQISISSNSISDKISIHSNSNITNSHSFRRSSFEELTPTVSKSSNVQDINFEELKISSSIMSAQYSHNNNNSNTNMVSHTDVSSNSNSTTNNTSSSNNSISPIYSSKFLAYTEETLSDLFEIFAAVPEIFFNDFKVTSLQQFLNDEEIYRNKINRFVHNNILSLKAGLQSKLSADNNSLNPADNLNLFHSTCNLIMTIFNENNLTAKNYNEVTAFTYYLTCNYIIKAICDSCLSLSLTDPRFKSNLIFLNHFINKKDLFDKNLMNNEIIINNKTHQSEGIVCNSIERVLLLSLCTHDIQFYNIAKDLMKWYLNQKNNPIHGSNHCFETNLNECFSKIAYDDQIFTGFVSLHKRIRNILRGSRSTKSLYQVWLIVYQRWCYLLFNSNLKLNEENLLFRHFTGFLVSISGCFISDTAFNEETYVSEFFDKCINLLNSQDLIIRVIIKDALSNESHSAVYKLITNKLIAIISNFEEHKISTEESTLFTEQVITIITAMIAIDNIGAVVLTTLLPEICLILIKVINIIDNPINATRLKLRFCRLAITIESNRSRLLLAGAYKLRNFYAKAMCEWLEQSAFFDEVGHHYGSLSPNYNGSNYDFSATTSNSTTIPSSSDSGTSKIGNTSSNLVGSNIPGTSVSGLKSSSSSTTTNKSSKEVELIYLNIDLATESSKALSLQLEELILEVPDGTSESDLSKNKDLAFANYFSLFYKILTKYTSINLNSTYLKSKYKVQLIVENVLKCITNLLQYDTDIGLQFVFSLGYHENKKIRSLLLNVFASMLYVRKEFGKRKNSDSFKREILDKFRGIYDIHRASSVVASNNNHTLFANSLYDVYGYLKALDKIFNVLLNEEINNVSRTSDIFRRNSILTKLLAKLAKDEGFQYLTRVLKDFLKEFTENEIIFNVEKETEMETSNPELFMKYLNKLIDLIVNSSNLMPNSFKYICTEIYQKVCSKVPDAGLIAVGSFIFLRFFCPAIISPETFFEIDSISNNNKKSLLQLVKVIQNMANKTLTFLKWKSLNSKMDELNELNSKIFYFLNEISNYGENESYPFEEIVEQPVPEFRYFHKFFYTFYKDIKTIYLVGDFKDEELIRRVKLMRTCDEILKELGQPKSLLNLKNSTVPGLSIKNFDNSTANSSGLSNEYNEFMDKSSKKYGDIVVEVQLIHNAIFHDGTPVVVINLSTLRFIDFDVHLLIYKLFETASQVWDNKFYFVFDFTGFATEMHLLIAYGTLMNTYAPPQLFRNCARIYYFNIPVSDVKLFLNIIEPSKVEDKETRARFYTYSHCDSNDIISSLCLSEETTLITRDKKVEFNNCKVLDSKTQSFKPSTLKIGRQFFLLCSDEFIPTNHELCATRGFRPVEIYNLSDIIRCEITKSSGSADEFTIYLANDLNVIIKSPERSEILRFLYFTTSRLPKNFIEEDNKHFQTLDISNLWFGRLFNLTFQSLLSDNDDVKTSAVELFASVANYFEIDYNISKDHAKSIAYPINSIDFIVAISNHLSNKFPQITYRFLRAYFDSYDKLPINHRMDAILYVTPWIKNICDYVYLENEQYGPDRVAGLIRQFCHVSSMNKSTISVINDYVWKKLFSEPILVPILLDEIVSFAMDTRNDNPDWGIIISVITPSVEICGEAINKLIRCVGNTTITESEVASESKLFEIRILVKICSSLFFDAFVYAQLFLADVFFLCTLFIDNRTLEFGADLQKLVINTIESFLHKPDLTETEQKVVEDTLTYFTSQRSKMLFGLTREKSSQSSDISQLYNRSANFETLCDYLNEFISALGSADDRSSWKSRWSSYAIDVAFTDSSLFQVRGILVVGILSKSGINDQTASRMLKLMSRNASNTTLEYMTIALMSTAKIIEGLDSDSIFPSIIIWPQLYFGMLNYSSLYQASIQCLLNTLIKNFEQGPEFIERIFKQRKYLNTFIADFEDSHGFHINEKNILAYIFFVFTQGLKLSHIKHTSLNCIKTVFRFRYDHDPKTQFEIPSGVAPYLTFIWLSTSDVAFEEYLETTNYKPSAWIDLSNYKIPKVLIDYLLDTSAYATLTLYQAAYLFSTETVEDRFKSKFLFIFDHVFNLKESKGLMVYHIVKQTMETSLINNNSIDLIEVIARIMEKVARHEDYSLDRSSIETEEFLDSHGLMIMKNYKFRKLADLLQSEEGAADLIELDNQRLQEMIYRAASSYVDYNKLEH